MSRRQPATATPSAAPKGAPLKGARLASTAALALLAVACAKVTPPGELVGAYHIDGELLENTCGQSALPAMDPLSYDVELRRDEAGRGIWLRMPPAHYGRLEDGGTFSFELESVYPIDLAKAQTSDEQLFDFSESSVLDPERYDRLDRQAMQTCSLSVLERVAGRVARTGTDELDAGQVGDAGTPEDDLLASDEIKIRAVAGSRCEPLLTTYGGQFEELPCTARYTLRGRLHDPKP